MKIKKMTIDEIILQAQEAAKGTFENWKTDFLSSIEDLEIDEQKEEISETRKRFIEIYNKNKIGLYDVENIEKLRFHLKHIRYEPPVPKNMVFAPGVQPDKKIVFILKSQFSWLHRIQYLKEMNEIRKEMDK